MEPPFPEYLHAVVAVVCLASVACYGDRDATREHIVCRSATGLSFQVFRVASALHRDLRGSALDVAEVVGREFDGNRTDVLLQAREPPGAGDGNNPGLL